MQWRTGVILIGISTHTPENVDQEQIDRYIGYGAFQLEHKNFENAIELFNKAIELGDRTGLAYANLGSLHHELNNYRQSVENYDEAIKLDPSRAGFYNSKAQVLVALGDKTNAKLSYEKAIQLNNNDTFALNNLGILLAEEEKHSEALGYFDKVLAIDLADEAAITNKISTLARLDIDKALAFYVSMDKDLNLPEAERAIADTLMNKHTEADCILLLEDLYSSSKEPKYIKLQSWVLYDDNKLGSFDLLNTYLLLNPADKFAANLNLDLAFELLETIGESRFIEAVDRCLALDEKNPTALGYKIQILLKEQKLTEALDSIDALFSTHYSQQKVLNLFTHAYNQLDKEAAMLRFRRLAKQLDANAAYQLGYMRGLYLKEKGYHDEAISTFNFLNEEREFSWNYYQIAIIENIRGNTERCLLYLKKTFELEPELRDDAKQYVELQNLAGNVNFQLLVRG